MLILKKCAKPLATKSFDAVVKRQATEDQYDRMLLIGEHVIIFAALACNQQLANVNLYLGEITCSMVFAMITKT